MRLDRFSRYDWFFAIGAALAVGGVCLAILRPGPISALLVPLPRIYAATLAGACFWLRARKSTDREKTFWRLWSWGCWFWAISGIVSLFSRSASPQPKVELFSAAFTFLPQVLFMAALVMQPEISEGQLRDPVVRYEAALVGLWWTYLYALLLIPWHWVLPNAASYWTFFRHLHDFQNAAVAIWLLALTLSTRSGWRRVYGHLTGAVALFGSSMILFYVAWNHQRWLPTMVFQALIAAAFLWMSQCARTSPSRHPDEAAGREEPTLGAGAWLASITALGIPAVALWFRFGDASPEPVRRFRLLVSFGTFVVATLLLYRWQDIAESQRERLVEDLTTSVQELRQLQGHFANTEKLASLGQLAAGAAHEIYNPIAAMLGYSELLQADASTSVHVQDFGRKIGEQTRRIRSLLRNLLSLAETEKREVKLVDVAAPLRGALELSRISSGTRKQNVSLLMNKEAFWVHGDAEKLLQVFYGLLVTLSGHGETIIEVHVRNELRRERVTIELAGRPVDRPVDPESPAVYDAQSPSGGMPFSLDVCSMIVEDHGGTITRESFDGDGTLFRVDLPTAAERSLPLAVS